MANAILTIAMIAREALRVLENNLTFTKHCARDYDDQFAVGGAKIGDTLNIRRPPLYTVAKGQALVLQDHVETQIPLVLTEQAHVGITFSSTDLALSLDDFSMRVLEPAVSTIANQIDQDGLLLYRDVANTVGVPGALTGAGSVAELRTWNLAQALLDEESAPRDRFRSHVMEPRAQVEIVDALRGLFHSSTQIEEQYEQGTMGIAAGGKWSMDQNVATHIPGVAVDDALSINGAGQDGSTLTMTLGIASETAALRKGDIFTIADVFAVNQKNKISTGQLRYFTVTADVDSTGGAVTVPISPPIVGPLGSTGPVLPPSHQNVDALPAVSAACTIYNPVPATTARQNLVYHRDAFQFGCADLPLPDGVDRAARVSDSQLGISLRMIRNYDITTDLWPCRIDVLYGYVAQYPQLACRVQG